MSESEDGPLPLRLAVALLWGQAAALGALCVVELVKLALGQADDIGVAALLGAGILGVAGVLVWAGWRLTYRRASARGVAVALELSALPVAWYMLTGEGGWGTRLGGGLVAASCAAVIALLLVATSTAALRPPA